MIRTIAFDLDDTLLDTTHRIIPKTCMDIYYYLVTLGFQESFEVFNQERLDYVKKGSHKEFFKDFVFKNPQLQESIQQLEEPSSSSELLIRTLIKKFYEPDLPQHLPFIDGVEKNLDYLKVKYSLYVVTSGVESAQIKKLKSLQIDRWIPETHWLIVSGNRFPEKIDAFHHLLQKENAKNYQLLSIGNRLSQEIHMAKAIGAFTCYFQFGEHSQDVPAHPFEIPDFTIIHHSELIEKCRL